MKHTVDALLKTMENHLVLQAIQAGLGANSWERLASQELLHLMRNAQYLSATEAREIIEALGEKGQKKLSGSTLQHLLEIC